MKSLFFIGTFLCLFAACNKSDNEKKCCHKPNDTTATATSNTTLPEESIFILDSKWITQNGDTIALNKMAGKTTVAAMVFTHCASACPRIVADLQRIEKSFTDEELKQINFLLISMDPERDTPARFIEFSKEHQLNDSWILISSNEAATMEMANVLGVRVKKLADGGFDHSNIIHVIDSKGVIVHQQNGLEQDPLQTIQQIKSILGS